MDSARLIQSQSTSPSEISRSHPIVARVLRRWRMLTGGGAVKDGERRTLVAVSGGSDSTALATILASVTPKPVIAHIVHDLRDPEVTAKDLESVRSLAAQLGCEFIHRSILVASVDGNTESNARNGRYKALAEIACECGIEYIATGHHADDQLETMLMNLMRGAGPRGLGGVQGSRSFEGITIIRPMLGITHLEAINVCEEAGISYVHDHTNDDESLTRNKIRHQLLPLLRAFEPDIAQRSSRTADACRSSVEAIESLVNDHVWSLAEISEQSVSFERCDLQQQKQGMLAEVIRLAILHLGDQGANGLDRVTQQTMNDAIRAIQNDSTERRECRVGPIVIEVHASSVRMMRAERKEHT